MSALYVAGGTLLGSGVLGATLDGRWAAAVVIGAILIGISAVIEHDN